MNQRSARRWERVIKLWLFYERQKKCKCTRTNYHIARHSYEQQRGGKWESKPVVPACGRADEHKACVPISYRSAYSRITHLHFQRSLLLFLVSNMTRDMASLLDLDLHQYLNAKEKKYFRIFISANSFLRVRAQAAGDANKLQREIFNALKVAFWKTKREVIRWNWVA